MDWFLFGILVYEMLTGRTPFPNLNQFTTYEQMKQQKLNIPEELSTDAKALITSVLLIISLLKLLQFEPQLRLGSGPMDADEIITHPFFKDF